MCVRGWPPPAGRFDGGGAAGVDQRVEALLTNAHAVLADETPVPGLLRPARDVARAATVVEPLREIVGAARILTGAGFAGLGVLTAGAPFRFIADGGDNDEPAPDPAATAH